jgi:hypothetical protein
MLLIDRSLTRRPVAREIVSSVTPNAVSTRVTLQASFHYGEVPQG